MKKGLSTLIEVILLLLIAISLTTMVIVFLPNTNKGLLNETNFDTSYDRSRACLNIENINKEEPQVAIKNCGKTPLKDLKLFIDSNEVAVNYKGEIKPSETVWVNYFSSLPDKDYYYFYATMDLAESPIIKENFTVKPTSWFDSSWKRRQSKSLFSSVGVDLDVVLNLTLDTKTLIQEGKLQSNCNDLRFTDSDENLLKYELESCNDYHTTIWLRVPFLAADNSTSIRVYYDNPSASSGERSESVWDSNYMLVYHMRKGTGTVSNDSTSNKNNITFSSNTTFNGAWAEGAFGNSTAYNGGNAINGTSEKNINTGSSGFTIESWIYYMNHTQASQGAMLSLGTTASPQFWLFRQMNYDDCFGHMTVTVRSTSDEYHICANEIMPSNRWIYVVGRWNGTYRTDAYIGSKYITNPVIVNDKLFLGQQSGYDRYFGGYIDEVRISNVPRSNEVIKVTYDYYSEGTMTSPWGRERVYSG